MSSTAISLLNEALNLAVRGRRLDEIQHQIQARSITPQLWVVDQYERDLHDWEVRARAFLTSEQGQ